MRLLLGIFLWIGLPFYIVSGIAQRNLDPATTLIGAALAICLAVGEYTRHQQRERRKAMQRAQEKAWTGR